MRNGLSTAGESISFRPKTDAFTQEESSLIFVENCGNFEIHVGETPKIGIL
jgi:hypothetical protein